MHTVAYHVLLPKEHVDGSPSVHVSCSGAQSAVELAARNVSLLDQLSDLVRQAALAARKPLLDWLRLLTQVQGQEPQQQGVAQQRQRQGQGQGQQGSQVQQQWQQERQGLLREVVRLRSQLQVRAARTYAGFRRTLGKRHNWSGQCRCMSCTAAGVAVCFAIQSRHS